MKAFQRRQLNVGGAEKAFTTFCRRYPAFRTPTEKLLAIDRLIHEFHYALLTAPSLPTRAVGVNLIKGKLRAVLAFLDELAYAGELHPDMAATRAEWAEKVQVSRTWFLAPPGGSIPSGG